MYGCMHTQDDGIADFPALRYIISANHVQVGCPEARIDENVAKLTAAGYKVSVLICSHTNYNGPVCVQARIAQASTQGT